MGNSLSTEMKIAEFANGVDLDEVAHNEPPHRDIHCLQSSLLNSEYDMAWMKFFFKFSRRKFCRLLFGS